MIGLSIFNVCVQTNSLIVDNHTKISYSYENKNLRKTTNTKTKILTREISEIEKIMRGYGLVDINDLDTNIIVKLQYATSNNFLGENVYGNLTRAYLQKEVAEKLINASNDLIKIMPSYRIVILDAARPLSIQKKMWDETTIPQELKEKYLANPIYGSLHNYGAAVDLTLADTTGKFLDMGTQFDCFENIAYPSLEQEYLTSGQLSPIQVNNRLILRSVMKLAGFSSIATEWWHFSSCNREYAKKNYQLIVSHIFADNPKLNISKNIKEQPKLKEQNINDINFRIQILASETKINKSSKLFNNNDVSEYFHNNLYKYTIGKFNSIEDALTELKKIKNQGYSDSFIVAFNKNKRIGIKDASELMQ